MITVRSYKNNETVVSGNIDQHKVDLVLDTGERPNIANNFHFTAKEVGDMNEVCEQFIEDMLKIMNGVHFRINKTILKDKTKLI